MVDMTTGKEGKHILKFALPMLAGNIFQQLYNIVDSVIVGNFLGKEALAAVGASFPVIFVLISMIIGLASGITIVISQYFGAKDYDSVRRAVDTMYITLLFASIVTTVIGIIFSEEIFRLLNLPEDVMPIALDYLNIYLLGMIGFFGFNATSAILRGLGDSKTPLYFLIISTVTNIGLDLLFVIVFNMGVKGVALATIISQGGAFLTAALYLNKYHELINISLKNLVFDRLIFTQSYKIGLPTGLQQTFVALGIMAIMGIVNSFGTDVIAAFSVASRLDAIATIPAMILAQALATFVGQNLGANKPERVRSGLWSTVLISTVVTFSTTLIIIFFGSFFMDAFTNDTTVIRIGHEYLTIVSLFYMLFAMMFIFMGVMRGAGDTLIPMLITLLSLWLVRVPLAYILSSRVGNEVGIWWSFPIGWAVGLILAASYYSTGRWKKKVIIKHQQV
ncbi:MAG TPA: MATE family efflux transporter [Bacteroidales bacterium]|nr:MATE family efflux transporter [Bacteroidales bacterium]